MNRFKNPKTIDTCDFGRVECPISVNYEQECLETFITYGINDLVKLVDNAHWYYLMRSDKTKRQSEIAELLYKLSKLLRKEKSVEGRIWAPILLRGNDK